MNVANRGYDEIIRRFLREMAEVRSSSTWYAEALRAVIEEVQMALDIVEANKAREKEPTP